MIKKLKYSNPYLMGILLGLVITTHFVLSGVGVGASAAIMKTVVAVEKVVAQDHVDSIHYLAKQGGGDKNPFDNWIVFVIVGVLAGGLISGALGGRIKKEIIKGPGITNKTRLAFAAIGGVFFGFGSKMAQGCASGQAISGGSVQSVGSWVIMLSMFAGAFGLAYFVRKLWI